MFPPILNYIVIAVGVGWAFAFLGRDIHALWKAKIEQRPQKKEAARTEPLVLESEYPSGNKIA